MRGSDFNYKVALASGLRSLQAGQLRKAEEQFRYLRDKFPDADGGYRGLAKIASELGDRAAALAALRDGAAALARAGERTAAIGLLREILNLEPLDHTAHRRLAAALILANERDAAAAEYQRYTGLLSETPGGAERARLEREYAREQLGGVPSCGAVPSSGAVPAGPSTGAGETAPAETSPSRAAPSHVTAADDPEARAAAVLAMRDVNGAAVVLDAAREHIAAGRLDAATDLLLQAVAAGVGAREAERLLVDTAAASGNVALARERADLLARLDDTA